MTGRCQRARAYAANGRTTDQHDAYSVAVWLRQADLAGQLAGFLDPNSRHSSGPLRKSKAGFLVLVELARLEQLIDHQRQTQLASFANSDAAAPRR